MSYVVQPLDQDDENLSINSCANCNRSHRKCDRKLPICTECFKKNKTCVYETPKRVRKPQEKKPRFQPYPTKDEKKPALHQTQQYTILPPMLFPEQNNVMQFTQYAHPQSPVASFSSLEQILTVLPGNQHDMSHWVPALENYFEQVYLTSPLITTSALNTIKSYRRRLQNGENVTLSSMSVQEKEEMIVAFAMQGNYIIYLYK